MTEATHPPPSPSSPATTPPTKKPQGNRLQVRRLAPSQSWSPMISPEVAYLRTLLTEVKRVQRSARNLTKSSPLSSPEPPSECSSDRQELGYCLLLAIGRGKILKILEGSGGDFHIYTWTLSITRSSPPRYRQLRDTLQMVISPIMSPISPRYLSILILPRISP
ncbi:origin recognition complex second largest subunit 2 [Actinidia rufa]|uniref:Origin recognition complex second largest subunit 2 n=1 Tax=Actinidia rufa TaxID=165716 RepID=A0A7J0E2A1_9ERIC|nr:origin recognition complex second largest subunit 2 [Actinidia rufa]